MRLHPNSVRSAGIDIHTRDQTTQLSVSPGVRELRDAKTKIFEPQWGSNPRPPDYICSSSAD